MTSTTRNDLERRLRSTFQGKSDRLVVRELDFDQDLATHGDLAVVLEPTVHERPRRRWTVLAAAALALVVVLAVGAGAGWFTDSSDHGAVRTQPSTGTTVPEVSSGDADVSFLAPSAAPAGMKLWSVRTSPGYSTSMSSSQLFGAVDTSGVLAPGILIETQPVSPGAGVNPGGPADATVRGQSVTVGGAKDGGEGTQEFAWIEGDAEVRVTIRGTTVAHAAEILDALKPRGASLRAGFDPASAPAGITQLGESTNTAKAGVVAAFTYASAAPSADAPVDLAVWTASGAPYPGYLRTWMAGMRAPDGTAVELDPDIGVFMSWPDGRQVVASSKTLDRDALERVARSVKLLEPANARQLTDEVAQRLADLPVLFANDLPSGRVELRGTGTPSAICLRVAGAAPVCASTTVEEYSNTPSGGLAGTALVDGRWLVFAAAPDAASIQDNQQLGTAPTPIPVQTATAANGWPLALAAVPDGVERVMVVDRGGRTLHSFTRPTATR